MLLVSIYQHLMSARLLVPPRCYLRLEKAILECFGDTIAPLQLLLYSLRVVLVVIIGKKKVLTSCGTPFTVHFATTFTILGFRKRNLFIIFYYVHYAWSCQKNKTWFQHYRHEAKIMKKMFTLGFIKNTLIATMSTTMRSWQKSKYFHFSTTIFTTPWW